jgi:hypothetical protein
MTTEQKQIEALMNSVGAELNNKEIGIVIPVLSNQLASAGVMCGIPLEDLLKYVTMTIVFHYVENSHNNEPVH